MTTDSFSDNRKKRHIYMDSKLDDLPLTMEAYRVYCHLCRRAGCDNNAFPSYKSIGEACFRGSFPNSPTDSLRRKAIAAVNELIAWNLIHKTSRSFDGLQTSNHYSLTDMEDWFTASSTPSTLIRGSKQHKSAGGTPSSVGGIPLVVLGGHPGSAGGTPPVVLGGHPGSVGGTPKDYPIEDYPIEVYPLKDALRTQELCVCEETDLEQLNQQKEPIPESSSLLSNQSKSSHQTDNPSCRLSTAGGSFDFIEQANKDPYKSAQNVEELIEAWITDPTTFADDFVPLAVRDKIKWSRWVLPWRSRERKLHPQYQNFNPIVVDLVAVELASTASCTKAEKITHAIAVMNTWEKTKGGWTNLMQRYQQALLNKRSLTQPTNPNPTPKPNISLAQAIAQDEQRRHQEQAKQTNSALPQHSSETLNIKEKLLSLANAQKTRTSSRLSAAALLEVEAQLKQALGA
jgi:hypothetical protein